MNKLSILVEFPYFDAKIFKKLTKHHGEYRLIIDSGAFSAFNSGKKISLDEYCKFLDSIESLRPFNAVQLDVIGNPEQTYKNFLKMEERGYDVMPVFTRGDTLDRLEEFYSHTDYIMFGGNAKTSNNRNYVKWFLGENKGRKCHWLGFVQNDFIARYKPHSVDSSSWLGNKIYGHLPVYDGKGNVKNLKRQHFVNKPSPTIFKYFKDMGFDYDYVKKFAYAQAWKESYSREEIAATSYVLKMQDFYKHYGTRLYLAFTCERDIKNLFSACERIKKLRGEQKCAP